MEDKIFLSGISTSQLLTEIRSIIQCELSTLQQGREKSFLNISEASEFLGLSKQTIYRMTSEKKIPFIKRGKLLFEKAALVQWLQKTSI